MNYFLTMGSLCCRIVASSFNKCGRFPVFSSCSITATTISSFILSVSIFIAVGSRSDGGGVVSRRRLAVGKGSCLIFGDKDFKGAVGEAGVEREGNKPSHLNFFGRELESVDAVGGEDL